MSFLTDTDLKRIISNDLHSVDDSKLVIYPFDEDSLTPVGYDLRVGTPFATSDKPGKKNLYEGNEIVLAPNSTSLITTLEDIRMPKNKKYSGLIESKVTKVSKGLSHISTTVDPDWQGKLLIAVHNHSREKIKLMYGETFCTIVFFKNVSPATQACNKTPDRLDVFLEKFDQETKRADRKRKWKSYIPPLFIIIMSSIGYLLFGNNVGFSAMVVLGVAISQFIADRIK